MKTKKKCTIFLCCVFSFSSLAMEEDASPELYEAMALAFFPNISLEVTECAVNWNGDSKISLKEREIMEKGYLRHAGTVLQGNYAPKTKNAFEAMAIYYNVKPLAVLKLFGCARWYTGKTESGENLFIEANKALLLFTDAMIREFFVKIDAIRDGFAGDATTRDGKIANILVHIAELESMKNLSPELEAELASHNDAIIDYILSFNNEERERALDFAIFGARSSLEIVKEFVAPTSATQVLIVGTVMLHSLRKLFI